MPLTKSHPLFKDSSYLGLNKVEKGVVFSHLLDNFYHKNNQWSDPNGHSQEVFCHGVSKDDFLRLVRELFEGSGIEISFEQYRFTKNVKDILKKKDFQKKFQSWTACNVENIFNSLKHEAIEKKRQQANKVKVQKEQERKQEEEEKRKKQEEKRKHQEEKRKHQEEEKKHQEELKALVAELGLSDSDDET